jgi:hypothetical protein
MKINKLFGLGILGFVAYSYFKNKDSSSIPATDETTTTTQNIPSVTTAPTTFSILPSVQDMTTMSAGQIAGASNSINDPYWQKQIALKYGSFMTTTPQGNQLFITENNSLAERLPNGRIRKVVTEGDVIRRQFLDKALGIPEDNTIFSTRTENIRTMRGRNAIRTITGGGLKYGGSVRVVYN